MKLTEEELTALAKLPEGLRGPTVKAALTAKLPPPRNWLRRAYDAFCAAALALLAASAGLLVFLVRLGWELAGTFG